MFIKMNLSKTELELLNYSVMNPGKEFYCKNVSGETGISMGAVSQGLRALNRRGFIESRKKGRETYYSADITNPLIKHFKIFSNLLLLNGIVENLKKESKRIVLFGSCAKGEDTEDSDIDLFILTDRKEKVKNIVSEKRAALERKLSPIIVNSDEFAALRKNDAVLYNNIEEGLLLWNEKDEP